MKKIMSVLLAVLMVASVGMAVANAEPKQMPGMFAGTITQIGSDNLVLKGAFAEFMTVKVNLDDETKYFDGTGKPEEGKQPPEIKLADLKVGDKVACRGVIAIEEEKDAVFTAKAVVKIEKLPKPEPPKGPGDDKGDRDKDKPREMHMMGVFQEIKDKTLVVQNPDGSETFNVVINDKTRFVKIDDSGACVEKVEIKLEDLKKGDKLVCIGMPKREGEEKSFMAFMVTVISDFPPPPTERDKETPKPREMIGQVKSIDGKTLTLTPWVTDKVEEFKVAVDENTKYHFLPKPTEDCRQPKPVEKSFSDLKTGQKVVVRFIPTKDEGATPMAVELVFIDEFPPRMAMGKITEISDTSVTIAAKQRDGEKTMTLKITTESRFFVIKRGEKKPIESKWSDFAKDDIVELQYRDDVLLIMNKLVAPPKEKK